MKFDSRMIYWLARVNVKSLKKILICIDDKNEDEVGIKEGIQYKCEGQIRRGTI